MKITRSDYSTSRFLKASDLASAQTTTTVANIARERLRNRDGGDQEKLVVTFDALPKPLPLRR